MNKLLSILIAILGFSTSAFAQVTDDLHLLTQTEVSKLNKKLSQHKIGVVIRHTEDIEKDALEYGRGPHGVEVVIWYSPAYTKDEVTHKGQVRIEVGTYKEGNLTDMSSNEILSNNVKLLKEKKYYQFFDKVSDEIIKHLGEQKGDSSGSLPFAFIVLIIILWLILYFICPDCALILLYLLPLFGKSGSNGDFSGGGSSIDT